MHEQRDSENHPGKAGALSRLLPPRINVAEKGTAGGAKGHLAHLRLAQLLAGIDAFARAGSA